MSIVSNEESPDMETTESVNPIAKSNKVQITVSAEKKAAEKKAAEKKAVEKKAAEKKAVEKKAVEKKAAEKKVEAAKVVSMNIKSKIKNLLIFLCLVVIPWLLISYYITAVAHPRYVSSADVVVKQVSTTSPTAGLGVAALFSTNNTSIEDAKYLMEFIVSNDMIKSLDEQFDFRQGYHIDGTDFIYEINENATQEELLEYFKERISVSLDEQTNILTVSNEGFDPEYVVELNKAILIEADKFVNKISQQVAVEQLQYAQNQVVQAETRLGATKNKLLTYQNKNRIIDPQSDITMISKLIGTLQAQLSTLRTEERQLLSYLNPDAPQIVSIRSQLKSVEIQIKIEQEKLTSPNNVKLNLQNIEFETIKSEVDFATELYKISLASFEKSRLEAFKKMKNLILISTPYTAEDALYPRKNYVIWTSLMFLFIFYGFFRLVITVIKDHKN